MGACGIAAGIQPTRHDCICSDLDFDPDEDCEDEDEDDEHAADVAHYMRMAQC
jgi:hypothetical protein